MSLSPTSPRMCSWIWGKWLRGLHPWRLCLLASASMSLKWGLLRLRAMLVELAEEFAASMSLKWGLLRRGAPEDFASVNEAASMSLKWGLLRPSESDSMAIMASRLNVSEVGTAATVSCRLRVRCRPPASMSLKWGLLRRSRRRTTQGGQRPASMSLKWGLLRQRHSRWLVKGSFQLGSASAHLPGAVFFVFSYQQMRPEA
jgi:hypothetical protein